MFFYPFYIICYISNYIYTLYYNKGGGEGTSLPCMREKINNNYFIYLRAYILNIYPPPPLPRGVFLRQIDIATTNTHHRRRMGVLGEDDMIVSYCHQG